MNTSTEDPTTEVADDPEARAQPVYRLLRLDQLHPSPWNPRKTFDPADIEQLADSIEASGILTPALARPRPNGIGFELAAGHRRRAAGLVVEKRRLARGGAQEPVLVPTLVREMTDEELLEVLVFENDHRTDVHPLEEAEGFRALMERAGYDVARLAKRAGRHIDTVYDRLKLLQLTEPAQKLFLANRFTLGHAVILARLSEEHQARAIDPDNCHGDDGLFSPELRLSDGEADDDEEAEDEWAGLKPVSVREFQSWVDRSVRFDAGADDVGDLFPETADALVAAEESAVKVIAITYLYQVPPEARSETKRIYTERAWQRADGEQDSKTCDHSVLGLVEIGPHRGQAFPVCIAKEKCEVHYADRIRERKKRDAEVETASTRGAVSATQAKERAAKAEAAREAREAEDAAVVEVAESRLAEMAAARIRKMPAGSAGVLGRMLVDECRTVRDEALEIAPPLGKSAEDLVRHVAFRMLIDDTITHWSIRNGRAKKELKAFGIDVDKVLAQVRAERAKPKTPEKAPATKAAKKPAKKRRR